MGPFYRFVGHEWLKARKVLEVSRRKLIFRVGRCLRGRLGQISPEKIEENAKETPRDQVSGVHIS